MQIDYLTDEQRLTDLLPEWQEMAQHASVPFYSRPEAVKAWWDAHGDRPELSLRVITAREGTLLGVAPLVLESPRSGPGTIRFAAAGDYRSFTVADGADSAAVVGSLLDGLRVRKDWKRLMLGSVPSDDPLAIALLRSEWNPYFQLHVENPYIDLDEVRRATAGGRDYFSRSQRKSWRRLRRAEELTFSVLEEISPELFEEMAALHVAEKEHLQNEGRIERHSLYEDSRKRDHYRLLQLRCPSWTAMYRDASDSLIAYSTAFVDHGDYLMWNSAYHPALNHHGVVASLRYEAVHHLAAHTDARAADLGAGRYAWKFHLTPHFRSTYKLDVRRDPPTPEISRSETLAKSSDGLAARSDHVDAPERAEPTQGGSLPHRRAASTGAPRPPRPRTPPRQPARTRAANWVLRRRAAVLPPVIWYAPHPDDETIFMGGSIAAHRGRRNIVVSLSRGSASTARRKLSKRLGREVGVQEFTDARAAELRGALEHLGVPPEDHRLFDLPDGGITVEAVRELIGQQVDAHPGAEHRTMSFHDPHPDHSAAGQALADLVDAGVVKKAAWHVPVSHVPEAWGEAVDLPVGAQWAKKRALREYQAVDLEVGRYGIGGLSVSALIRDQFDHPRERIHGRDVDTGV